MMLKNKRIQRNILIWIVAMGLTCNVLSCKEDRKIDSNAFYNEGTCMYVKYSTMIAEHAGQQIRVPIFLGNMGEVTEDELSKYIGKNEFGQYRSILSSLCFNINSGETKKKINELLKFYQRNLLKSVDIYHPTIIGQEGSGIVIWYDYKYEGVIGSMMILVGGFLKTAGNDIRSIQFDEKQKLFHVEINIGEHSPFYKGK